MKHPYRSRIGFGLTQLALCCALSACSRKAPQTERAEPIAATNIVVAAKGQTNAGAAALTNAAATTAAGTNRLAAPSTNAVPGSATNTATAGPGSGVSTNAPGTNAAPGSAMGALAAPGGAGGGTNTAGAKPGGPTGSEDIPLSFQGANVDMVAQWLAKTTGKSVVKHPRVQCQLTIISSKNLPPREAINLVYRALALEGFNTIESAQEIFIVPDGQEPKLSPQLINSTQSKIPEGRQRLIKVYPLKFVSPAELRDKIKPVLSEKAVVDVDDRASQLIVTDYNENLRLLEDLVKELDVASSGDSTIQIYTLKHSEAEELGNLITLILNAQSPPPGSSSSSSSSSSSHSSGGSIRMGGPGMPMPSMPSPSPSMSSSPPSGGGGPGQQFRVWPDKTANRLIVAAPRSKLPEVEKLIDILDVEKPEDVGVRVIPLKNVNAEDFVKEIGPLYQKLGGNSLKDMIEVTASSRANSLIVLSSESNYKSISKLLTALDTEEAQEKIMHAFPLKNADAEDVAKQLKDLGQDQDSQRYPYYYFYGMSDSSKSSKKPSVVADRRRNTVIVQAPRGSMESIAKMIEMLDEPVAENALAPKIFHLKFVSAVDLEDVLNELFLKKQQQRSYFYYFDENPPETPDRDVGRLYGKVRITSEPYSNTLIVTSNSKESLDAVADVIRQLDSPSESGDSTLRISLKFAKASDVANSVNILFAKNGSPPLRPVNQQPGQPAQPQLPAQNQIDRIETKFELDKEAKEEGYFPWLGGQADNPRSVDGRSTVRPVSDLVGRVRVVPDLRSNALLVSANVHLLPQILKLVADLDAPTEQVLIEARLVEVTSDYLDKLGVRWSPDGSQVFTADDYDNSFAPHVGSQYQKGYGGNSAVNTPAAASGASAPLVQTLTSLRSGVLDSSISMDFLIQFLRRTTAAKVLAEPQINIRDNETGRLFVGQEVPVPENTILSGLGNQNTSFTYKPAGVTLEVTPHINSSGDVELSIHAQSTAVVPGEIILGGAVFDTRNFRTDLTAKNGQTLVLGGIIQKEVSDTVRKTPILGDIPGLGWAFKKKDKTTREVELMVFMRPKVTHSPEQAEKLLNDIYQKAPAIKQWDDDNANSAKNPKASEKSRN